MTNEATIVSLEGVTKKFGGSTVVRSLDLDVQQGEFFSLLGPSGCGKTTTLRMIAGFTAPDSGRILLEGVDVTKTPPYRRNVNTVFQSYALFEHLSVAQNIGFGLKRQRVAKSEIQRRVCEMLELVDLGSRANARPADLSGGQKQRVALARSIVNMPKVLLLDEPLGALDLKLRRQMQGELKKIQREVGITFVYVTHDQEEALSMSDRIGVMNDGQIEQLASPEELYNRPVTPFVAGFIGSTNLIEARIEGNDIAIDSTLRFTRPARVPADLERVMLSVRPEDIRIGEGEEEDLSLDGIIAESAYLGYATHLTIRCRTGQRIQVAMPAGHSVPSTHQLGSRATISWRIEDTVFVPIY